ncbi:hypothetical protein Bca4012_081018 [Brassica carinata]
MSSSSTGDFWSFDKSRSYDAMMMMTFAPPQYGAVEGTYDSMRDISSFKSPYLLKCHKSGEFKLNE